MQVKLGYILMLYVQLIGGGALCISHVRPYVCVSIRKFVFKICV